MSWALWVTGPPGSGKTTVTCAAVELLRARGRSVRTIELDAIRRYLVPRPEYTEAERELVYRALVYFAVQLVEANVPVIVDATANRRRWRELARAAIRRFGEVQLVCPLEVCRQREGTREAGNAPSEIYARAGAPGATVPGVDVPYETSLAPELLIDSRQDDVPTAAGAIASLAERLDNCIVEREEGVTRWAIWITGRPGSGKTTLAQRVAAPLAAARVPIRILDFTSARRAVVGREWAGEAQEAFVNRTLALATKILCESGVAVILDAAAPRRAWRDTARDWITHFAEVQLVCPSELCAKREQAVRWRLTSATSARGEMTPAGPDVTLDYEESLHPELRVHTHTPDLVSVVDEILRLGRRLERLATSRSRDRERIVP